jgi:hypothetical protein
MSKFAPVEDNQSLEEAMAEQRIFYRSTIKEILDTFETRVLVPLIKDLINSATDHGTTITPILLSDIMDVYEIESQRFHEIEESNILECLSSIRAANTRSNSESQVKSIFDILNDLCDNWYFITEPLHVYSASKGIFHSKSKKILDSMRSLSIETSDNFGNHELSLRLIKLCYRIFYNFMDTRKILREDMLILDKKINVTRKNILDDLKHDVNFAKDISYRVIPNDSSTNVFSMSPNGISYNNQHFNLDTIESVRWGGNVITTNYGSHSRKHAELKIIIRNENSRTMNIMVNRESIFQEITKRLHYSVGLPFILESLNELKKGRSYDFGDMTLRNSLISVKHKNLIMDTEVTYNWSEITVKPEAGNFVIYANNRSNPLITLPYLHIENIVFIGPIIQKACEKNVKKLSDLSSMM